MSSHVITMAEVDAYYEGLLQEIKELENLLNEWTPVKYASLSPINRGISRGKGDTDGQRSQEDNQGV